jgi:hypothetical protein
MRSDYLRCTYPGIHESETLIWPVSGRIVVVRIQKQLTWRMSVEKTINRLNVTESDWRSG